VQLPPFDEKTLQVPSWQDPSKGKGDLLIDNFEYWDSPLNHGWVQLEPPYPFYGFGIGYATILRTVIDLREGARVLDVYRPPSVFLLNTMYERYGILYDLYSPPVPGSTSVDDYIDLTKNPVLSFKFRAPVGIEPWDIFEFEVTGITRAGYPIRIHIRPIQPPAGFLEPGGSTFNIGGYQACIKETNFPSGPMVIHVNIGRNYLDGTWHILWLDLLEVGEKALDCYEQNIGSINRSDWEIVKADQIRISGQMFRLDDVAFRTGHFIRIDQPDMFEPGPLFAQIFEPYRYLFMSEYESLSEIKLISDLLLDLENFITDKDKIRDIWISDLLRLDPDYHVIDPNHPQHDPNYTNRWLPGDPNFGKPDHVAETYIKKDFFIDSTLPVFADQNFRLEGKTAAELRAHGTLGWNMTVGGYGQNAIQALMIHHLPIDPYDGIPTYIPRYYRVIDVIKKYGKQHFGPQLVFTLESALWNVGMELWPNIIYMDYEPLYFEDLIVSLQVTNGIRPDVRTFPISVINYPLENYPPVTLLHTSNRVFYFGQQNEYALKFMDPDCFIFSLAQFMGRAPSTTHLPMLPGNQIRTDMENLTFRMTLGGLPSYQYGPWIEDLIDPCSGLISFTPKFEGAFRATVTCTDDRGASSFGSFTLFSFSQGTWLNHPPIYFGNPTRPILVRAGEEVFITAPDLKVMDPDGDELYASCNIGTVGRTDDGGYLWTFHTNFPGTYNIEIIFYDIRGGYLILKKTVVVKPWWSY
jgi:hypothetical protein